MNKNEALYWRYKKKVPPTDENKELNGPVIVIKSADSYDCNKHQTYSLNRVDWYAHIAKYH
jgi:hypothetical protein